MTQSKSGETTRPLEDTSDAARIQPAAQPRKRMKVKTDVRAGDDGIVNGHKPP